MLKPIKKTRKTKISKTLPFNQNKFSDTIK